QWVQDVARRDVILDRQLRHVMSGIVAPRRQQPVAVLVDHEGGEVVVLAAVFQAVLTVREDVDEIVTAVIAPGCRPLAGAAGVGGSALAPAAGGGARGGWLVGCGAGGGRAATPRLLCPARTPST